MPLQSGGRVEEGKLEPATEVQATVNVAVPTFTSPTAGSLDRILIDVQNFGPALEQRQANPGVDYELGVEGVTIEDALREAYGSYWTTHPMTNRVEFLVMDHNSLVARDRIQVPFRIDVLGSVTTSGLNMPSPRVGEIVHPFGVSHEIAIVANQAAFTIEGVFRGELFHEYLNETYRVHGNDKGRPRRRVLNPNEIYQYAPFALNTPMFQEEANSYADLRSPMVAGAKAEYIYNSPEYEQFSKSELLMPNLYATYFTKALLALQPELANEKISPYDFISHTNMIGFFDEHLRESSNDYFASWVRASELLEAQPESQKIFDGIAERFSNVFFDPDEMKRARDMNRHKNMFPFFTEVQFRTDPAGEFVNLLMQTRMEDRFMLGLMQMIANPKPFSYQEQTEMISLDRTPIDSEEPLPPERIFDLSTADRTVTAMSTMISFLEGLDQILGLGTRSDANAHLRRMFEEIRQVASVMGLDEATMGRWGRPEVNGFERNLLTRIFFAKYDEMVRRRFMTWDTSFNLHSSPRVCHSETVAYRIEKRALGNKRTGAGVPVQNFYCMNLPDLSDVEIIDTQVLHDRYYKYTIYAYQIVFGTKYMYDEPYPVPAPYYNPVADDTTDADVAQVAAARQARIDAVSDGDFGVPKDTSVLNIACEQRAIDAAGKREEHGANMSNVSEYRLCVHSRPFVHIVEVPLKTLKPTRVMDNSPVLPQMLIVPYRQVTDRVLINLNSGMDDYVAQPIVIEQEDAEQFAEIREAQDLPPNAPIRFKTDDGLGQTGHFEVWKLDRRPEKYEDFAEGEVSAVYPSEHSRLNPTSGALTLFVKPNRKYYLCARTIDVHGKVSNPTEVYEIEIVYDDGIMYFLKRAIELKPIEPPRRLDRPMKRFIKIAPSLVQSVISFKEEDGILDAESATDLQRVKIGEAERSLWGRKFKVRFISKDTGRRLDLNLDFSVSHAEILSADEN